MPDNPNVVALLKEYRDEASLTRTEAGRIIGKTRGQIAGICQRKGIAPWPVFKGGIHAQRIKNRGCQFPIGMPGTDEFRLCGMHRESDPLLCNEHKGKKWTPNGKIVPLKK